MVEHPQVKLPNAFIRKEQNFSSKLVDVMANVLGSTTFIYFCLILDAIGFAGLIYQTNQSLDSHQGLLLVCVLWVTFIAQAVIQLVALPVLQNYQNRQSAMQDAKASADHMALTHIANQVDMLVDKHFEDIAKGV